MDIEYNLQPALSYMQELLDKNKNQIPTTQYQIGMEMIHLFIGWHDLRNQSADDLYSMIELKEDGEGVFEFAECGDYENKEIYYMWQIILSILMIIVSIAYQNENAKYVPQDIEIINIHKAAPYLTLIEEHTTNLKYLFEYFCREVCH